MANNVLAHVPDIAGFVGGFRYVLKDEGVLTWISTRIEPDQQGAVRYDLPRAFLLPVPVDVEPILRSRGLRSFNVELIPTHGGSLAYSGHEHSGHQETRALAAVRDTNPLQNLIASNLSRFRSPG